MKQGKNIFVSVIAMLFVSAAFFCYLLAGYVTNTFSAAKGSAAPKYVGMKTGCICHKMKEWNVYEVWEKSEHSKAFETLKSDAAKKFSKNPTEDPKCLECHTTGFGKGGYDIKAKAEDKAKFENVQCEACHGAGEKYKTMDIMKDEKKAKEAGLIIPDEKTCLRCHNEKSPVFDKKKGFKFGEMFPQIKHGKREK